MVHPRPRTPRARSLAHGEAKTFRLFASLTPTSLSLLDSRSEATGLSRSEILERLIRATGGGPATVDPENYRECLRTAIAAEQFGLKVLMRSPSAALEAQKASLRIEEWQSLLSSSLLIDSL